MKDGSKPPKSSGQAGDDCCKGGSTIESTPVENVSNESADMRGGGSKE
jgi:hypothetical protein